MWKITLYMDYPYSRNKKEGKEMIYEINQERLLKTLQELIETPSVVGYYPCIHQLLEELVEPYGLTVDYDRRHTAYVKISGQNPEKTVCLGAHFDTIGMVVRSIEENGWLSVRNLGGLNFHSLEGENVLVHTRFNGDYTGMVICKSHSVHVFDDARELERDFPNMKILIDEDVHDKTSVEALGIRPGDLISVDPKFVLTDTGYIKSRHIDDKASAAVLIECIRILVENGLQPKNNIWFAFPIYEEIGLGGAYVPDEVEEYLALDIGLIGHEQSGDEKKVSISGADRIAPYDWDLTSRLIELAEENDIDYVTDIYYRYGSDATAALNGGNNIVPATIGMGTMNSHGHERTHIDGIVETLKLSMAYIMDSK